MPQPCCVHHCFVLQCVCSMQVRSKSCPFLCATLPVRITLLSVLKDWGWFYKRLVGYCGIQPASIAKEGGKGRYSKPSRSPGSGVWDEGDEVFEHLACALLIESVKYWFQLAFVFFHYRHWEKFLEDFPEFFLCDPRAAAGIIPCSRVL